MVCITSAAGVVAMLDEEDPRLREYALNKLDSIIDLFWAETADVVDKIEMLYEDESFSQRELAALVASKVYYHLGELDDALTFALGAGHCFDVNNPSQYVSTLIAKCIDEYVIQTTAFELDPTSKKVDARLEKIVERMFDRCFADGVLHQAVGIALESRRLDILERAIMGAGEDGIQSMLEYCQRVCLTLVQRKSFRDKVLRLLVRLHGARAPAVADHIAVAECLLFLDDSDSVAKELEAHVLSADNSRVLLAYQIAFDLVESGTQKFLGRVRTTLAAITDKGDAEDSLAKLDLILSGSVTASLELEFLFRNNATDIMILTNTKTAIQRNSVCHSATVISNAFMHTGTTGDVFLRDNLEWLGRATNWAKFTATASLGTIHRGHVKAGKALLAPYLPQDGVSGSAYSEGGSLYALGLIYANHGHDILPYLMQQLRNAQTEVVQHGACLGLGLAGMATGDSSTYDELKFILYTDSAVAGEAAGLAMGLVMLGSGTAASQAIEDMAAYAHETQHEKILRGLTMGMALVMYAREEEADPLIEQLMSDKDPILRLSGMQTVGMAYCGTGNNDAIRKLLHVAVSDTSDDVRRAAVSSLGFVLFRQAEQCPAVVSLLSESYNPHVRYGAAMALGISCAGSANEDAVALLEPLTTDSVDYVRQGAWVAMAMVLIQASEVECQRSAELRVQLARVISDKHEDTMAKFGAILAQGLLDAGGRNVTISLQSHTGHTSMPSVVGLLVFTQFWFWYPMSLFASLAFSPTSLIGLNESLDMPVVSFSSDCKKSQFAHHPNIKPPEEKKEEKVETAVLSITDKKKKEKAKGNKEKEKKDENAMDIDKVAVENKDAEEDKQEAPEPSTHEISNPARCVPKQLRVVSVPSTCRYRLARPAVSSRVGMVGGVVVLMDSTPGEAEEIIKLETPTAVAAAAITVNATETTAATVDFDFIGDDEPEPPQPFEWSEDLV